MRRSRVLATVGTILLAACVVDRPVVDEAIERSASTELFAVDCRAWVAETGEVEAQVSLVDFAKGEGELVIRWSIDGQAQSPIREARPRIVREGGRFMRYSLERSMRRRLPPGEHQIAAVIDNLTRSASCAATITVP